MQIPISKRAKLVEPFLAMELMERAKELETAGQDVIYLCLGEPDFNTPAAILAATGQALAEGATSYTHSLGLLELRQEICRHYLNYYGVKIVPDQVIVSSGTSPLMLLLFSTLLDQGDELILTDPGYACYPGFVKFSGGAPVLLKTAAKDGFQPKVDQVKALMTEKTRGLLINSPSNPAGSVLSGEEMQALAQLPIPIISDEIYHGLTYHGEERCILEFTENAFVLGGFSKAYAMTGWRLGFLISPLSCIRTLQTLHQNFLICANHFVQRGGIAALQQCDDEVDAMRSVYDKRRIALVAGLRELGFGVHFEPQGAFYVLADARHIDGNSQRLALDILEKTGVAVTPGVDFGQGAEGFLRFSYTRPLTEITVALQRLGVYLRQRGH
ncbi:Aspartate/methionine/tyrosine aminotransferase [Desulfuromusa kysingii]|uniref:Aminotransferase n=1 Tax=Desulfuromusa kysingii TaxID=37625 RepID=A0A1H3W0A9_9BACT|nr:pyridoxal phosphate-dependent aminotransferase [Desulfuromusa kysingii]SDZ80486.1 Aspartate/methionine/tyrosine aminotransferase [Desulfuromusa kysingii]